MSSSDRDRNLSKAKDNIKNLVKKLRPQIKKEYELGLRATVKSEDYYGPLKNNYPNHQKVLYSTFRLVNLEDKNAAKVQQVTGVQFQGFTNDMLEDAERKKLDK